MYILPLYLTSRSLQDLLEGTLSRLLIILPFKSVSIDFKNMIIGDISIQIFVNIYYYDVLVFCASSVFIIKSLFVIKAKCIHSALFSTKKRLQGRP